MRLYTPLILLILLHLLPSIESSELCPEDCSCLGNNVDCSSKKLATFLINVPSWAETLFIQSNSFADIGKEDLGDLPSLINLKILDLSSCSIRKLPTGFASRFPNLIQLNLKDNEIKRIPSDVFKRLRKLQELNLRGNRIQNISSDELQNLKGLVKLDVGRNEIFEWPTPAFTQQSKLGDLLLDGNRISFLKQKSFENLSDLRNLKLNKNRLRSLNKGVFINLTSLVQLDLSRNRIRQLSGLTFAGLERLRSLKLNRNGLKYLEDGTFWGLHKIKELQLKQNKITVISKGWTYGMESLQRLYLCDNDITQVDNASFAHLPNLNLLDLSANRIQTLTPWNFRPLSLLTQLDLSENKVEHMTNLSLSGLGRLEILDISRNRLASSIEDGKGLFSNVQKLSTLRLGSNGIRTIPENAFSALVHFTSLDLTDNPITSISPTSFNGLEKLNHLLLNSSSLVCDCQLDWLPKWMKSHHFQESNNLKCGDIPEQLKGNSIYEIDVTKMTCENSPKPVIIQHPNDTTGLYQGDTSLECVAVASPNVTVNAQWKRNDIVLYEEEGSLEIENSVEQREDGMLEYKSMLKIINVVQDDTAKYQCIISNKFGSAYSKRAKLTVYVYPSFLKTPENVTRSVGQTARLVCAALGYPKPEIKWEKDGGQNQFPAASERRMHVMANDDVFFIVQLKPQDAGTYTCKATNAAGEIRSSAIITIQERPTVMKGMEDETADAGSTVVFECVVAGYPKPNIKWYFNGSPIVANNRKKVEGDKQILLLLQVDPTDQGTYACEIENQFGVTKEEAKLTVIGDLPDAKLGKPHDPEQTPPTIEPADSDTLAYLFSHPGAVIGFVVILVVVAIVLTSIVWVTAIYCRVRKARHRDCLESANSRTPAGFISNDENTPLQSGLIGPCSPPLTLEKDGRIWKHTTFPRNHQPVVVYSASRGGTGNKGNKRAVYRLKDSHISDTEPIDWRGRNKVKGQTSSLDSGVLEDVTANSSPILDDKLSEESQTFHSATPPPLPPRLERGSSH